ncbi:type II secretion system GspH family protein [Patescibacteria group bacterium]|nr:type II secretion system GspH family protein [Patescibacteria group bacterium]
MKISNKFRVSPRFIPRKSASNGFTLVEVLIYVGILGVSGALLSGVLFNTTKIKNRQTAVVEVNNQLNFTLQSIQRSIMDSSVIDIDNDVSTSTLILMMKDDTKNPTQIYISDGILYRKEASGTAQPLTNDRVVVDAVNFFKVSGYTGHDSVKVDLTISYNTQNETESFSRTLSSAIARVSAATFDSNLVPGSTNYYDIGVSATKWKDMHLSGDLYAAGSIGIGTTEPGAKLAIQGTGTYNSTNWGTTSDMAIRSSEMTDNAYHSILQLVSIRQSLTVGQNSQGYLGFSTIDDSNAQGMLDAGRIAIVNEAGGSRNSATALSFWTNPGGATDTVAATEKVRITSTGKVGIGTTVPAQKLVVDGVAGSTNVLVGPVAGAGYGAYNIRDTSAGMDMDSTLSYIRLFTIDAAGVDTTRGVKFGIKAAAGAFTSHMIVRSDGNVGIASTTPWGLLSVNPNGITGPAFVIGSSTATKLIVTNGGNVGIGTAAPDSQLHIGAVVGDGSTTGLRITSESLDNMYMYWIKDTGFHIGSYKSGGQRLPVLLQADGGNVGIGTAAPGAKLEIIQNGTSGANYGVISRATGAGGTFNTGLYVQSSGATTNYGIRINTPTAAANQYAIYSDATAQSYFAGNVGIGTAGPGAPLELFAEGSGADTSGGGIIFSRIGSSSYRASAIFHRYITDVGGEVMVFAVADPGANPYPSGTGAMTYAKMVITQAGRVGIGTTVPTSPLQVVGLPVYANNAAAVAGGLTAGAFYRTGGDPDPVCVVH